MNLALIIIGLIVILIGIGFGIFFVYEATVNKKEKKYGKSIIFVAVGILIMLLSATFVIIPTGFTGVKTTFGQIDQTTLQAGFHFKMPLAQQIELVNNKQQDIIFKEKIWAVTSENTNVFFENVVVSYRINPEKSAYVYATVSDYKNNLVSPTLAQSALKAGSVKLQADKIVNRGLVEPAVKETMQEWLDKKYGSNTVHVIAVNISNIDFEEAYSKALEEKQLAQKLLETQQIENKKAIEKAEAEKQVALTNAEAEAEAKIIRAKAEAEANKLLTQQLNEKILLQKYIEKWNGQVPQIVVDKDGNYILQLPKLD